MTGIGLGSEYQMCKSSLKAASLDNSSSSGDCHMTDSPLVVYDFDKVKDHYSNRLALAERPKSVDALASSVDGDIYLIEFKNGDLGKSNKGYEIRQKIYDSLFILYDLLGMTPANSRGKVVFVLVYNESKNSASSKSGRNATVNSRMQIKAAVFKKANKSFIPFGLAGLKGYCLKDIHSVTENQFDKKVVPLLLEP